MTAGHVDGNRTRAGAGSPPRRSFWRNVAVVAGGTAVAQGIALGATPILTRLFTPAEYGAFGVFLAAVLVATAFASLRFEFAVPLPLEIRTAAALLVLALLAVAVTSVLVAVVMAVAGSGLAQLANAEALDPYLWLVPIGVAGASAYQVLTYWAIREREFGLIARTKVTQALAMTVVQVGSGIAGAGVVGLVAGGVVGQTAGSGRLTADALRRDGAAFRGLTRRALRKAASRYRRFPILSTPSALLNHLGIYFPVILLSAFYGTRYAGLFALTQRAINVPLVLIGTSVAQTYMGEAAAMSRERPREMLGLFDSTAKRLAVVALLPVVLGVLLAPEVFTLVFGRRWREAGEFVQVLAPMLLLQFVSLPLSQTLNILERLGTQLAYDTVRLVLGLGGLTAAYLLGASPVTAVAAYGAGMAIAYALNVAINRAALRISMGR